MAFMKASDGAEIYYETGGDGVPVILIAGLASDHRHWYKGVRYLEGYRIVSLDNRGCGQTKYEGEFDIGRMAADVAELSDELGLGPAHVIGWSMGSHIAINLASRYPEKVRSLCLVGSYVHRPARSGYILGALGYGYLDGKVSPDMFGAVLNTLLRPESWFRYMETSGKKICVSEMPSPEMVKDQLMAVSGYDAEEDLKKIRVPVLSVHGLDDIMTEPSCGDEVAAALGDCEVLRLPGEGHIVSQDKYFPRYREFIDSH